MLKDLKGLTVLFELILQRYSTLALKLLYNQYCYILEIAIIKIIYFKSFKRQNIPLFTYPIDIFRLISL